MIFLWQPFVFSVLHHFWDEKRRNLNYFKTNYLIKQIWQRELFLGPEFKLIKNFHVWRHFDVTMTERQKHIYQRLEKFMASFFNQST